MMHGDGGSTVSGMSGASSTSSKRFRLFGFGKRRKKRADAKLESIEDKSDRNLDYGYGYGGENGADNEQAPARDQYYGNKSFDTPMEDDNVSNGLPYQQNGHRLQDEESSTRSGSISAIQRQDSNQSASSSSSLASSQSESVEEGDDESSESQSNMDEFKSTEFMPQVNNSRAALPSSKPAIEPRRNLKIVIPRRKRKKPPTPYSILTRTKFFQNMIDHAFDMVDTDHTGFVDEKQLYNALLLIHLKLGMVAGQAACRPLPRARCRAIFARFDIDDHGYLNREEFGKVMVLMFSNVLFRVVVQWTMTILIVPLVAKEILDGVNWTTDSVKALSQENWIASLLYRLLSWMFWRSVVALPAGVLMLTDASHDLTYAIPDRIWSAVPLTLLSTLLGILIVPLLIYKVDSATQWLADRRHTKKIRKRMESDDVIH